MIHYTTSNASFKKMYYLLQEMGVQNNSFFMELKDETLLNINPLDEDSLTNEQKIRIHNEITENPFYFFREIVRIPGAGGKMPFELTRATLAILWVILLDLSAFVVLPRQSYKTYTVVCMYDWLFYWGCKDTEFGMFSYDSLILKSNLSRIKTIRDNLPSYLNLYNPKTDKDNEMEMKYVNNSYYNWIRIKAPSKSKDEATKIGRGFSMPNLWYDEPAFIPNIKEQYESAVFAYKTAAALAKASNSRHHRIMTTTPGYLNTEEGLWCFNFINDSCPFTEKMYDYDLAQIKKMIATNSQNGFIHIEYMYYDLGKSETYLDDMLADNISADAFRREVLLEWATAGTEHPLGRDILNVLPSYKRKPNDVLIIDDIYFLRLYKNVDDIDFTKKYVGGLDSGGNVLKDFSVLTIVDPENYEVVGVLRTNSRSTAKFSRAIGIVMGMFENMILVPERNSMGIAIVDEIIYDSPHLERRVYHDERELPGFANNKNIRFLLYNVLLKQVSIDSLDKLHDESLINEIVSLTVSRTGRIDHPPGGHDDTLLAYLFVRWFLAYGHRRERYISIPSIGINANVEGITNSNTNYIKKRATMKDSINSLILEKQSNSSLFNSDGSINRSITEFNENKDYNNGSIIEQLNNNYNRHSDDGFDINVELVDNENIDEDDNLYESNITDIEKKLSNVKEKKRTLRNKNVLNSLDKTDQNNDYKNLMKKVIF